MTISTRCASRVKSAPYPVWYMQFISLRECIELCTRICVIYGKQISTFPPKVLYVSNITQDALLSVQNKSLLFYTRNFSNECVFFFLLYPWQKRKKNITAEIPYYQQKVLFRKCCYKMTWSKQSNKILNN